MLVQCNNCHLSHEIFGRPPGTTIVCRCDAELQLPETGDNALALTCPQCGGQADKDLARCVHCESALATVRCANCYGLAFEGHAHCFQCGGSMEYPAAVVHETGRNVLPCPRCRCDLITEVVENTLVDGCRECGGIWLDLTAFERMREEREKFEAFVGELNIPTGANSRRVSEAQSDQQYVRCPLCDHFMHRRNFARRSNIIIDVCAAHGVWFDEGELAQVLKYQQMSADYAPLFQDRKQNMNVTIVNYDKMSASSEVKSRAAILLRALTSWWY